MKLGAFSVSLAVKDIKKSFAFYSTFGFKQIGGDIDQNWIILKNEETVIGLFQGMFEKNILTFNPGWDSSGNNIESFDDITTIKKLVQDNQIEIIHQSTDEEPATYFVLEDPDGNQIMFDQHR